MPRIISLWAYAHEQQIEGLQNVEAQDIEV